MASSRIQRWALKLSCYQYNIRYKSGSKLCNADALSRLPRPISVSVSTDTIPSDVVNLIEHLLGTTISCANIKRHFTLTSWPEDLEAEFKPYIARKKELSVVGGCVLWGSRVIVPSQGRKAALQELHDTHPGASKMKGFARGKIWWPCMDR